MLSFCFKGSKPRASGWTWYIIGLLAALIAFTMAMMMVA